MANKLFYGDNLEVLRNEIPTESVDLIYLDPPFNSQATYNVLFRAPTGEQSQAQIEAFEDTWHWNETAEQAFDEVMHGGNTDAAEMLRAMRSFLRENDVMAYLTMLSIRFLELRRTLKSTGSLYLHCDPTAGHYIKILMDAIFGYKCYINEIIWRRYGAHNDVGQGSKHYGRIHDTILFYSKSQGRRWTQLFIPLNAEYIEQTYNRMEDETGRRFTTTPLTGPGGAEKGNPVFEWNGHVRAWRYNKNTIQKLHDEGRLSYSKTGYPRQKLYLEESKGVPVQSIWSDIPSLSGAHKERLGYQTQKPIALLERIIETSSNVGDIVLDPFCGCGTTIHAAQKLGRSWIGIDITHLAISLVEKRLNDAFPGIIYEVHGTPKDLEGAYALAETDKYQFQWWAVSLVNAVPFGGKKRGADTGIDGHIYFKPDAKTTEKAIVSVKGGSHVNVTMIRDLSHVVEREKAKVGVFITLSEPTGPMRTEAGKAGFYETAYGKFPKIQILTIAELFAGKQPQLPWRDPGAFRRATREAANRQDRLPL